MGLHPLGGSTLSNWLRVRRAYHDESDGESRGRVRLITAMSLALSPFRWTERLLYGRSIARTTIERPVFIVGHWRSGTTNVHNLMLNDPQFGFVRLVQCFVPTTFLAFEPVTRWFLRRKLPKKRPMDDVEVSLDAPMSDDFALAGLSDMTHYLSYFFPQRASEIFRRTVLFEGATDADISRWAANYRLLLRRITLASQGRRLLLKNPPHTARIRHVLREYPDARFIHVVRNPWSVHASSVRLQKRFLERFSLQAWNSRDVEQFISLRYQLLMQRFLDERHLIPDDRFIEVRYEDVVREPISTVERIYGQLELGDTGRFRDRLVEYTTANGSYQTNKYEFPDDYLARIAPHLEAAARHWSYEPPLGTTAAWPGRTA